MFRCMFDYFVERHGGVKGDEQDHVAIRVDGEPICCDVGAMPGRSFAMCGDPQATITNGCGFRQCKSGKNRLIFSEDPEQVACVSVHCKLVTRATQFSAYRQRRGGVKGSLFSRSDHMRRIDNVPFDGRVFPIIRVDYHRLRAAMVHCVALWKFVGIGPSQIAGKEQRTKNSGEGC
ncbi:MAG: hypothetical protein CME33_20255 [Gimesia sp.]|nr:hypothetical protein [Gimesia sp.]